MGPDFVRQSASTWALPGLVLASMFSSHCAECGAGGRLAVQGPTPFVRCLAAEPMPDRSWKLGELAFERSARSLTIAGLPADLTIAAFEGPSLTAGPTAVALSVVAAQKPHLALLVGGVGDDAQAAEATLAALAEAPFPTLVLSGGRDTRADVSAALEGLSAKAADRVIGIDAVRTVRIGDEVLLPIPGSADGRYARTDGSCGFTLSDLQTASGIIGSPVEGQRRWLLSWNAPGRGGPLGVARTAAGVDLGSDSLAEFARRVGAAGGIHAWPRVRPSGAIAAGGTKRLERGAVSLDAQLTVPVLGGPPVDEASGGQVDPGFAIFNLGPAGMGVVGVFSRPPGAVAAPPAARVSGDGGVPN